MTKYVIDTWAWVEYIDGSDKGQKVKEIVENTQNEIITHWISLAEIVSVATRRGKDSERIVSSIASISGIFTGDAILAGQIHAQIKSRINDFGLADACVLAAAEKTNSKIVTGDPHFSGMKNVVMI